MVTTMSVNELIGNGDLVPQSTTIIPKKHIIKCFKFWQYYCKQCLQFGKRSRRMSMSRQQNSNNDMARLLLQKGTSPVYLSECKSQYWNPKLQGRRYCSRRQKRRRKKTQKRESFHKIKNRPTFDEASFKSSIFNELSFLLLYDAKSSLEKLYSESSRPILWRIRTEEEEKEKSVVNYCLFANSSFLTPYTPRLNAGFQSG